MRRLIWTRPLSKWPADEELLQPFLAQVLHLPCTAEKAVSFALPATSNYDGVIFTSSSAVTCASNHPQLWQLITRQPRIFCVGESTALSAQQKGLPFIISPDPADGFSGTSLVTLVKKHLSEGARTLWLSPQSAALDFTAALAPAQIHAERLIIYETLPCFTGANGDALPESVRATYAQTLTGVVCFAAPSAVRSFCEAFSPWPAAPWRRLTAVAMGPTTYQEAHPWFSTTIQAPTAHRAQLFAAAMAAFAPEHMPAVSAHLKKFFA